VESLYERLCEQLAVLQPCEVAAITRLFLEVSSLPCEERLWSLEFAFDDEHGRVARLVASFIDRRATGPTDDSVHGYEIAMMLPRVLPARGSSDGLGLGSATSGEVADESLVSRFERALAELGAYGTIERIELVSAEAHLL